MQSTLHGKLKIDGFSLSYTIEGNGPTAIIIGSSIYYPRTFSQNLRSSMRMVFMDHRGFGTATKSFTTESFELEHLVDDIERLRQHLNLNKIIIIGHSGHGYIALEYAKKYPAHVSKIVIIAMSPDSSPSSYAAADRYFSESVCPKRKALLANNLASLEPAIIADPKRAFIIRMLKFSPMIWYKHDFDATALWGNIEVINEMFDYVWGKVFRELDIMHSIEKFDTPMLLMLGRYDYWNPPYLWEAVRSQFNNLTIRVFEKSGHTPQLEEPELFDAELLAWLQK